MVERPLSKQEKRKLVLDSLFGFWNSGDQQLSGTSLQPLRWHPQGHLDLATHTQRTFAVCFAGRNAGRTQETGLGEARSACSKWSVSLLSASESLNHLFVRLPCKEQGSRAHDGTLAPAHASLGTQEGHKTGARS